MTTSVRKYVPSAIVPPAGAGPAPGSHRSLTSGAGLASALQPLGVASAEVVPFALAPASAGAEASSWGGVEEAEEPQAARASESRAPLPRRWSFMGAPLYSGSQRNL